MSESPQIICGLFLFTKKGCLIMSRRDIVELRHSEGGQ